MDQHSDLRCDEIRKRTQSISSHGNQRDSVKQQILTRRDGILSVGGVTEDGLAATNLVLAWVFLFLYLFFSPWHLGEFRVQPPHVLETVIV